MIIETLFVDLAELLLQFGNKSMYPLPGLRVRRLSRQRPIFHDLDFEFYPLVFLRHGPHAISIVLVRRRTGEIVQRAI